MNEKKRALLSSLGISIWIEKSFSNAFILENDNTTFIDSENKVVNQIQKLEKKETKNKKITLMIIAEPLLNMAIEENICFDQKEKKILSAMFQSIGLDESNYFIAALPPNDQKKQEKLDDTPPYFLLFHLNETIAEIKPDVLYILGQKMRHSLLQNIPFSWEKRREQKHIYPYNEKNIPICLSYHPRELLNTPQYKREAYKDLCFLQKMFN